MGNKYSLKVFLVDTDPFCLSLYRQQLNNLGYLQTTTFNSAACCLDNLVQQPDVIFIDYSMDVVAELGILKRIKKFNPDIYVVFIVAPEDIEAATSSLKHGAFNFAVKRDHELEGASKILSSIYEIGEMFKQANLSFIRKFPAN